MKIKIKLCVRKISSGKISVKLEIAEKGDYPSYEIISHDEDFPTNPSPAEALAWVTSQIDALKKHLQNWREIQVIEDY